MTDVPLFDGFVKDVDEKLGESTLADWSVEPDGTRFVALVAQSSEIFK